MRLLVVEDEGLLAEGLRLGLVAAGFAADIARTCAEAEEFWRVNQYDAVVLDLGLPDRDGSEFLGTIRASSSPVPVLILSARGSVRDRCAALDAGADDYLPKPFSPAELVARLRALLRRKSTWVPPVLRIANVELDRSRLAATVGDTPLHLTTKEWTLFEYLLVQSGKLVTRSTLLDHCWDDSYDGVSNLVDVHVGRLRRKLEQAGARCSIATVRGAGFILRESDGAGEADDGSSGAVSGDNSEDGGPLSLSASPDRR